METTNSKTAFNVISRNNIAEIRENVRTGEKSLHAARPFETGAVICTFGAGTVSPQATYLTVQTGDHRHITLVPEFLQYTNHSCDPNVFFDTTAMQVICLKPIREGEELTFFYPSTEWAMAQSFACHCGSESCLHTIQGAAYLPKATLAGYRLTDFILQKLAGRE